MQAMKASREVSLLPAAGGVSLIVEAAECNLAVAPIGRARPTTTGSQLSGGKGGRAAQSRTVPIVTEPPSAMPTDL